jgi:hypothetical protein
MPTRAVVVHSDEREGAAAGRALGEQIAERLGRPPDAVILFASPRYEFGPLLESLHGACRPAALVGSSSSGEFTNTVNGEGLACAIALHAPEMKLTAAMARGLSQDRGAAARSLGAQFQAASQPQFAHRSALLFADALAGHMEEFIQDLVISTGGSHQIFGGGAGGDASFDRRFVFLGREAIPDAAVSLEILSHKPVGLGVRHGWHPAGDALRVTAAEGTELVSLNAIPAADVFAEHADRTGQVFDRARPLPFFLHNIIGVEAGGGYKLRVPLAVNDVGAVGCATEVPAGATVHVMTVSKESAAGAAARSTHDAVAGLGGGKPVVGIFFDCVATRLRMGADFDFELDAVREALGGAPLAGCNSIGQFARGPQQFSGFHNCTAVVCVIPE